MEERAGEGGSFVDMRGGETMSRGSEKDERGVFEKGEREAWRKTSVKVTLRGRGDDESRHSQCAGG